MKQIAQRVLRFVTLLALTAAATAVMVWLSWRGGSEAAHEHVTPVAEVAQPKALVAVESLSVEPCELSATFTGKVRPWETYTLGFEVAGRVVELGTNDAGKPLDDGARVTAGQMLARLDDRIFKAHKSEAVARLEEATTDMTRARTLRERNAITETEFQEQLTELALARAQHEMALKNLEDAVLVSPVDATIARRYVNVGESVQPNAMEFELVEDHDMLLVVDVPESQVYELQSRMRTVTENQQYHRGHGKHDEDTVFRAYVTLEGRDRFGRVRPPIPAEVYRIAQMGDPRTGLFEVEIRVDNADRGLRAGMVATARIVTDRLPGYRIPETAVLFRDQEASVFAVRRCDIPVKVMFWEQQAEIEVHRAERVELKRWIDQGADIVVPADEYPFEQIVVRGQQRLADGQLVKVSGQGSDVGSHGVENNRLTSEPRPPTSDL